MRGEERATETELERCAEALDELAGILPKYGPPWVSAGVDYEIQERIVEQARAARLRTARRSRGTRDSDHRRSRVLVLRRDCERS